MEGLSYATVSAECNANSQEGAEVLRRRASVGRWAETEAIPGEPVNQRSSSRIGRVASVANEESSRLFQAFENSTALGIDEWLSSETESIRNRPTQFTATLHPHPPLLYPHGNWSEYELPVLNHYSNITAERAAAILDSLPLPVRAERRDSSYTGQGSAPHVLSREAIQNHDPYSSITIAPVSGIKDMASARLHPKTASETGQESCLSETPSLTCDSDPLDEADISEHATEEQFSGIISGKFKEGYFTRLLDSFNVTQRPVPTSVATKQDRPSGSGKSGKGKRRATSSPTPDNSYNGFTKRSRRFSDKGDQDDQKEEGSRRNPPRRTAQTQEDNGPEKDRIFACPFVKRFPHCYLKCFSHSLRDISRVKQHLFRDKTHRLPLYCPNCSLIFEKESLRDEHIRDAKCVKKPLVKWEGITESQRRQLSKRSPSARSPEENWYAVFQILFPGEPLPSSPYIDPVLSGELRAFREHLLVEGPRIWNDYLTSQLPENLRPYLEELQSLHDSFYAESIVRLCESWYSRCSPGSSTEAQHSREDGTISHAAPTPVPFSTAALHVQSNSGIRSTDAHSEIPSQYSAHGGHPMIMPGASIQGQNIPLPDCPPSPEAPDCTVNSPRSESLLYIEDTTHSGDQAHTTVPPLQNHILERGVQDIRIDSNGLGVASDDFDFNVTFGPPSPPPGDLSSFSMRVMEPVSIEDILLSDLSRYGSFRMTL